MGTVVHEGAGSGVVVRTGARTAFGEIAKGLSEKQIQTVSSSGLIVVLAFAVRRCRGPDRLHLCSQRGAIEAAHRRVVFLAGDRGRYRSRDDAGHRDREPVRGLEGTCQERVLVKRLVAIEDLGNIEILFTDKTGTLTDGVITFEQALDAVGQPSDRPLSFGLVCNEAAVTDQGVVGGNALDQALWAAPGAAPTDEPAVEAATYHESASFPSTMNANSSRCQSRDRSATALVITKGAPEVVLERCVDVPDGAAEGLKRLFSEGARVVAVAFRRPTVET